jgi:hypothetical protein
MFAYVICTAVLRDCAAQCLFALCPDPRSSPRSVAGVGCFLRPVLQHDLIAPLRFELRAKQIVHPDGSLCAV